MRLFPIYAPKMIIKHVRLNLDGILSVQGIGELYFRQGRFVMDPETPVVTKQRIVELNKLIDAQITAAKLDA